MLLQKILISLFAFIYSHYLYVIFLFTRMILNKLLPTKCSPSFSETIFCVLFLHKISQLTLTFHSVVHFCLEQTFEIFINVGIFVQTLFCIVLVRPAIASQDYVRMSQCGMHVQANERNRTLPRWSGESRNSSRNFKFAPGSSVTSKPSRKCKCREFRPWSLTSQNKNLFEKKLSFAISQLIADYRI